MDGWFYIDNAKINSKDHIGYDGVHLNEEGVRMFARNLISHVRGNRQPRHQETSVGLCHAFEQHFQIPRTTYPLNRPMNGDQQHVKGLQKGICKCVTLRKWPIVHESYVTLFINEPTVHSMIHRWQYYVQDGKQQLFTKHLKHFWQCQ